MTLVLALFFAGDGPVAGFPLRAAVAGEAVAGIALYLFLDRKVFRPAEGYLRELEGEPGESPPSCGGILSPIGAGVAGRFDREAERFSARIRELEETVRRFEMLKRDIEETQSHLESKVQDLHSIYDVSTAIAGTLDTEELFHSIPERVMRTL
ncbi:MAG TPA: hypothetical protein VIS30_02325, partial [Candidatus Deferrimicrobiaceae bacterium]